MGVSGPVPTARADAAVQMERWILDGHCQHDSGATAAWSDARTRRLAFPYPEITGYFLTFAANSQVLNEDRRRRSTQAAVWLTERLKAGALHGRDDQPDRIYSFDLAMISAGLMAIGTRLGRTEWIESGRAIADHIRGCWDDGAAPVALLGSSNSVPLRWSTTGRVHLAKAVQCMLWAAEHGSAAAIEAADTILSTLEDEIGRVTEATAHTELHPLLYAAEGLWIWANHQLDSDRLQLARHVTEWVWRFQLSSGGFPANTNPAGAIEQSDVLAQAIRLARLVDIPAPGLPRAMDQLRRTLVPDRGGAALPYRPTSAEVHLNSWSTMFATQALGSGVISWRGLV